MILNGQFWQHQFQIDFIPSINRIVETFHDRLLPTFSAIDQEAEQYTNEIYEDLSTRTSYDGNEDLACIAETAHEAGISYYLSLSELHQGLKNVAAVMIYHCFEQHLMLFHRKELLHPSEENDPTLMKHSEIIKRLGAYGIEIESFKSWSLISELADLANTIKHGQGRSSKNLFDKHPDLFQAPSLRGKGSAYAPSNHVYTPLLGADIYVQETDIEAYASAVKDFWSNLGEELVST